MSKISLLVVLALIGAACSSAADSDTAKPSASTTTVADASSTSTSADDAVIDEVPSGQVIDFGPAPAVPEGEVSVETQAAFDELFGNGTLAQIFTEEQTAAVETLGASNDPRVAWVLMDMLRFARDPVQAQRLSEAAFDAIGEDLPLVSTWGDVTDRLIAWDIPEPTGYLDIKRAIYSSILPEWEPFFDPAGTVDWRYVSWGGVRIDNRPFDTTDDPCNCIPAADNPKTQPAAEATWLEDDDVVFGVVINGEARAYPRQIMEVREMVNDTLGGRDFAMPYCTLCGAAQVWFTDDLPNGLERPVLRTSGLLSRSNKVMYDLNTFSVFDTFLGTAQTGPLAEEGIALNAAPVVTSSWGDWRAAHPETDVLIEELALGRDFDFRNGRDADGPIFPIGDVDPRLPVQEDILGVITADGTPIAFHVDTALSMLAQGEAVEYNGISVVREAGGLLALNSDGETIPTHQAFWFAWSQFYPGTMLWPS